MFLYIFTFFSSFIFSSFLYYFLTFFFCLPNKGICFCGLQIFFADRCFADDLIKVHKFKPTLKWRQSFENYLKTMPPYYIGVCGQSYFWTLSFLHFIWKKRWVYRRCARLSTVPEESAENYGSTKPAGGQHGVRTELQRGVLPEETQSAGLLLDCWTILFEGTFKCKNIADLLI